MPTKLGYNHSLFILPFDHRTSFIEKMFDIKNRDLTAKEKKEVSAFKKIIYNGFKLTAGKKIAKESAAILVEEEFGDAILREAIAKGYITCLAIEKSGQAEFDFEYGDEFTSHIAKYQPTIVKVLIRYNPEGDKELNARQKSRLKKISDYCLKNGYKFMIEALVSPLDKQLKSVNGDNNRYDAEIRPGLTIKMVAELQAGGIEPDIWKIEGFKNPNLYKMVVNQIRADGRNNVGTIVLGRGLDDKVVEEWLRVGGGIDGIIGFAVGRTIFWQPLIDYKNKKISRKQATQKISEKYHHFYQIFTGQK